ncbi:MAG: class I SAM-dependent methyltransferase [Thermodesulfobacteriota bacterium]|nr:class I SAM-dependent methyltransferase [Thermodesulfobacteriota bacterium]
MNKEINAYSQAATSGRYIRDTGISGKYDNVRVYWEDKITQIYLRPYLDALVQRRTSELKRIRILDLGCGSGDGYEILVSIVQRDPNLKEHEVRIIQPDILGFYQGIDINDALLEQARERFEENGKISFSKGDISKGLPLSENEAPFDIYFTSYGTLSHFHQDETVLLFSDIAKHADDGALIVGDWLGRYSYEWQELWDADISKEQWMDYRISYIYPEEERQSANIESFPLRLLCREEITNLIHDVETQSNVKIELKALFDRSLLVGRHIDTKDYNQFTTPMRRSVNHLHEDYQRINFEKLLFNFHPREGFSLLNNFFENVQTSWNALLRYTLEICTNFDEKKSIVIDPPHIPEYYPDELKLVMNSMKRVVEGTGWLYFGDARANIIEPQLGYALRGLEMFYQRGKGFGHGIVGIFEVKKT